MIVGFLIRHGCFDWYADDLDAQYEISSGDMVGGEIPSRHSSVRSS